MMASTVSLSEMDLADLTWEDVKKMTVEMLKARCAQCKLHFTAKDKKGDLQKMLVEYLGIEIVSSAPDTVTKELLDKISVGNQSESHVEVSDEVFAGFEMDKSVENSPVHSVKSVKSVKSSKSDSSNRFSAEQEFELEKMRLQINTEREIRFEQRKIDSEIEQRKMEIEQRKIDAEIRMAELKMNVEIRKYELDKAKSASSESVDSIPSEHGATAAAAAGSHGDSKYRIDVLTKLVPRQDPNDVHLFFTTFERAVELNKIPRDRWPAIIHAIVFGKAQRVLAALTLEEVQNYDTLKATLLNAFDVCAEVFRKRFRNLTKNYNETYIEFSFKIQEEFERWLLKAEIRDFEALQQLFLLERFNQIIADDSDLVMWMLNKTPKTLSEAARVADEFSTLRRVSKNTYKKQYNNSSESRSVENKTTNESPTVMQNSTNEKTETNNSSWGNDRQNKFGGFAKSNKSFHVPVVTCAYCKKSGHVIGNCFKLRNRREGNQRFGNRGNNQSSYHADNCLVSTLNFEKRLNDLVDSRYRPHCFEVTVIRPDKTEVSLTCLRDTAALQSLIRDIDVDETTISFVDTREFRQICGIGGTRISVPLVQIDLRAESVSGSFDLGVCNNLPSGVDLLAGNDLFVIDDVNTCVVTRSQTAAQRQAESAGAVDNTVRVDVSAPIVNSSDVGRSGAPEIDILDADMALSQLFADPVQPVPLSVIDRTTLISLQHSDVSLSKYFDLAREPVDPNSSEKFYFKSGVLMRRWHHRMQPTDTGHSQVVAPTPIRRQLLYICHDIPASGHLGIRKSLDRLIRHFWWGSVQSDVREYVRTCHECQCVGKGSKKVIAPLYSMPIVSEPWSVCAIDIVGPLPVCDETGNRFILTILDLSTHFPEAVALKQHTARDVVLALSTVFSRVGFPGEILSDLGSDFTSELMQIFLHEFNIGHLRCSAYHPMTNGSIEKYHSCLKNSLKALAERFPNSWDAALCWVLFGYREVVNETTGFSAFELLYGRAVKGPLTLIKDAMLEETDLSRSQKNVVQFMLEMRERLRTALDMATAHAEEQRSKAKVWYDRKARLQEFKPGDKVLMLLPIPSTPLQLKLHGPYEIKERLGPVDYVISTPDRRKTRRVCHVNLLRPYRQRDIIQFPDLPKQHPVCTINIVETEEIDNLPSVKSSVVNKLLSENLAELTPKQQSELTSILAKYESVFSDKPGRTNLCEHHIELLPNVKPFFCRPYRLSPDKAKFLKEELAELKNLGIIEEAPSNGTTWASPVLMVPKADGTLRLCTDMRQVNLRTAVDPFPLPRIEELIDRVGQATFLTKLDMVRGYWQVPLDAASVPISGFVTLFGHFRWRYMPFGCRNAPATFSRLLMRLFAKLEEFCAAYLDDIIIFSMSWEDHKRHVADVLERIKKAGLTLNLSKSEFAVAEVDYLGYHIGRGRVQPREKKIAALLQFNRPADRKQLQQFLGLAGFYRKFLPNFSHLSAVLSNLLRKDVKFEWSQDAETAFLDLKSRLGSRPILRPPDFSKPFCMAVDASNVAAGGYLFQVIDDVEHPICFFSRKLDVHQRNYSTVEKEALGLVLAVRAFSVYFGSLPVTVYTDHNPLVFLNKMSNHNQKLLRWSIELQQYNLNIVHRSGKDNLIPDILSRPM